ncbi:MAG TPA: hypothetical protein VHE58_07980 [Burkholderiales bacterium]|nr:hypothetical protein [Burkholderiales bacterium]
MQVLERGFLFLTTFFLLAATEAWAHGFAGKRFFPTTLAVDDPFISDELTFLTNHIREPDQVTNEFSIAYSKRITPNFGFELGETYQHLKPNEGGSKNGFANLEVGAKYQFFTSEVHEAILSVGLDAELGRTGSRSVGAESFSTLSRPSFLARVWVTSPNHSGTSSLLQSQALLAPASRRARPM